MPTEKISKVLLYTQQILASTKGKHCFLPMDHVVTLTKSSVFVYDRGKDKGLERQTEKEIEREERKCDNTIRPKQD